MGRHETLAGGYVLLTAYTRLYQKERDAALALRERPTSLIAVAKEYLERWVLCSEYASLPDMLQRYTCDGIEGLADSAERAGFLAFEYRMTLDTVFRFPELCRGQSMLAFADFLSNLLQKRGHSAASNYIDATLDI